jgi:hypothetical protein
MTIHPMAGQPRAAAKQRRRVSDRVVGLCAAAALAALAVIAFASGQYRDAALGEPTTTGQAVRAPTVVPIDEAANPN